MASASAIASPHKPRRKPKKTARFDDNVKQPEPLVRSPTFPLESILWPARTSLSQWEILPLILMAVGLFRWAAGLWGYSGAYNVFRRRPVS
jgi:alpha-1,3-glucosyltransferase